MGLLRRIRKQAFTSAMIVFNCHTRSNSKLSLIFPAIEFKLAREYRILSQHLFYLHPVRIAAW
jgi:hypothetical protein